MDAATQPMIYRAQVGFISERSVVDGWDQVRHEVGRVGSRLAAYFLGRRPQAGRESITCWLGSNLAAAAAGRLKRANSLSICAARPIDNFGHSSPFKLANIAAAALTSRPGEGGDS